MSCVYGEDVSVNNDIPYFVYGWHCAHCNLTIILGAGLLTKHPPDLGGPWQRIAMKFAAQHSLQRTALLIAITIMVLMKI